MSGSDLFVANGTGGTVGEYTTSGATVNASLVTGLFSPDGVAVSGSNLFVTNMTYPGEIGVYTISNGQAALSNSSLITGLDGPQGILVIAAPMPGSGPLALLGSMALVGGMALRRRIARKQ